MIGNTPLVRLNRALKGIHFQLYAKLEGFNPGGSMKDRPALSIISHALDTGEINRETVVVESSSGNMGIGLAQVCSWYGLRFICIVDPKTTIQNIHLLRAYGAEVEMVSQPDPVTGEFLQARLNRAQELIREVKNGYWPNQYSNIYNPIAHHETMREIVESLGAKVDILFCATSTCGTIRGCAEYIRENQLETKIFAVDAVGSRIFGGQNKKRLIPGHGAAVRPALFQDDLADECIHVTDLECITACRWLVRNEAILAGGSSGAVLMAVERARERIPQGATCVMIFPDRGERYLDTIYSDEWVSEHFGEVKSLWEESEALEHCSNLALQL